MKRITMILGLLLTAGVIHAQRMENIAAGATAAQSSTFSPAANAIDDRTNTFSLTGPDQHAWLELAFAETNWIQALLLWPRPGNEPSNFFVFVSNRPFTGASTNVAFDPDVTTWCHNFMNWPNYPQPLDIRRLGRFVRIQLTYTGHLELGEVAVLGHAYTGPVLQMQQRIFVTEKPGGVFETQRQDALVVRGVPNIRWEIMDAPDLSTPWAKVAETVATNYWHVWSNGRRSATNGARLYRTQEKTTNVVVK